MLVAVKQLKPTVLQEPNDLKDFLTEVNVMRKLKHTWVACAVWQAAGAPAASTREGHVRPGRQLVLQPGTVVSVVALGLPLHLLP
jgi:serine/threonine protein kinase